MLETIREFAAERLADAGGGRRARTASRRALPRTRRGGRAEPALERKPRRVARPPRERPRQPASVTRPARGLGESQLELRSQDRCRGSGHEESPGERGRRLESAIAVTIVPRPSARELSTAQPRLRSVKIARHRACTPRRRSQSIASSSTLGERPIPGAFSPRSSARKATSHEQSSSSAKADADSASWVTSTTPSSQRTSCGRIRRPRRCRARPGLARDNLRRARAQSNSRIVARSLGQLRRTPMSKVASRTRSRC